MEKVSQSQSAGSESDLGKLLLGVSQDSALTLEKETTDCPIEAVTVYNDRAEVKRKVQFNAQTAGVVDIVVNGLGNLVEANSVRVSGASRALTILEVSQYTMFELQQRNEKELESSLTDKRKKLKELDRALRDVDMDSNVLSKRRAVLDMYSTESMKSKGKLNLEEVTQVLTFIRTESARLDKAVGDMAEKKKTLQKEYDNLKKEIEYRQVKDDTGGKQAVRISVHVPTTGDFTFSFNYVITNASWTASYDVRVQTKALSCQLMYYGSVRNTTGEDWKDVKLSLSTASPSTRASPPPLKTLRVRFPVPVYNYSFYDTQQSSSLSMLQDQKMVLHEEKLEKKRDAPAPKPMAVLSAKAESSNTSQTYAIMRSCTIDSDNKPHKVTISVIDLAASFLYTAIPKLAPSAYLKAHTTNNSNFQLLKGPMNVFSDNFFIASSELPATSPGGEVDIFLGTDPGVKVEFKPVKVKEGKAGMIKKSKVENTEHKIVITNNKANQIEIAVFEQVPLSQDDKVKIKVVKPEIKDNSEVVLNEFNNLKWHFKLDPQQKRKIELEYQIDYPADKYITIQPGTKEDNLE